MYTILRRSSLLLIISLSLILSFQALPNLDAAARTPDQPGPSPLERLAAAVGVSPQALAQSSVETTTLIDGRQITIVKAINRTDNEIVGAAFDGERQVDLRQEKQRAWTDWRRVHGALMPDLVKKIEGSGPQAEYTVAVWYRAQVEALPKPELPRARQDLSGSTALPAETPSSGPAPQNPDLKTPAAPLSPDQIPAEVAARALSLPASSLTENKLAPSEAQKGASPTAPPADLAILSQAAAFQQQNRAHLSEQIAPLRSDLLGLFAAQGYTVQYASEIAPVIFLTGLTSADLERLAGQPDIDAIYDASLPGGALLDIARPTQNADLLSLWGGYTGFGINVAIVEGERVSNVNPYLNLLGTRDTGRTIQSHPTGVAGIVGSSHPTFRGIASGAGLYSANGDDYATIAALEAAMDWGSSQAPILNNSFWASDCGLTSALQTIDRHMDYLVRYAYDLAVVASGNFNVLSCDGVNPALYVSSPAKGYNVLSVGNYQDNNTLGWSDDTMRPSSSYNHSGRTKPEVAASGSDITSTTTASPWTGPIGSGTSFSSPMVAGLAANLLQADSYLVQRPEVVTSIIMATALHNIEGATRLSSQDGAGGMVASAAMASVERGNYDDQLISNSTTFPIEYTQYAYAGETVRFAIRWLSNPDSGYTADDLPADLDLYAYRADGTTFLSGSISASNNFEIVEFVAPASETYRFRISLYGSYSGSQTWLGAGWWRGVYRISPDVGYSDPAATPMGTHLAVKPNDWSPTAYWRVMGIRPNNSDHDLFMYSRSLADDPALRSELANSTYGGSVVDFIAVDGNHWLSSNLEHYRIRHWSGAGGYYLNRSNPGISFIGPGTYGAYTIPADQVVKVYDVYWFGPMQGKRIQIIPGAGNAADLGVALFRSDPGQAASWEQGRGGAVRTSDASTSPSAVEEISYLHVGPSDWLGLVVFSNTQANAEFYINITDIAETFLPRIGR